MFRWIYEFKLFVARQCHLSFYVKGIKTGFDYKPQHFIEDMVPSWVQATKVGIMTIKACHCSNFALAGENYFHSVFTGTEQNPVGLKSENIFS